MVFGNSMMPVYYDKPAAKVHFGRKITRIQSPHGNNSCQDAEFIQFSVIQLTLTLNSISSTSQVAL